MTNQPAYDPREHLSQIQGRDYLTVSNRIDWLTSEWESYDIATEIVTVDEQSCVMKATVCLLEPATQAIVKKATGYGSETRADFGDYIEKAETKALGRALRALGFGTPEADGAPDSGELRRPVDGPRDSGPDLGKCSLGWPFKPSTREGYAPQCRHQVDGQWHNESYAPPVPTPLPTKGELTKPMKQAQAVGKSQPQSTAPRQEAFDRGATITTVQPEGRQRIDGMIVGVGGTPADPTVTVEKMGKKLTFRVSSDLVFTPSVDYIEWGIDALVEKDDRGYIIVEVRELTPPVVDA